MANLSDHVFFSRENYFSIKGKREAIVRALITNTEVELVERKTKLDSPGWK